MSLKAWSEKLWHNGKSQFRDAWKTGRVVLLANFEAALYFEMAEQGLIKATTVLRGFSTERRYHIKQMLRRAYSRFDQERDY